MKHPTMPGSPSCDSKVRDAKLGRCSREATSLLPAGEGLQAVPRGTSALGLDGEEDQIAKRCQ